MLEGIEVNRIIVGAYTDRQGGICPMLAAHRNGGRTSLVSFARAWDRYTGARGKPRPAREREVNTLRAMLEASIGLEEIASLPQLPRPRRCASGPIPASATGPPSCAMPRAGPGCGPSGASTTTSARCQPSPSPGRMNWSSGTTQLVEVRRRKRMASAMSSGWIMFSLGT
jgi:hypothetical protein